MLYRESIDRMPRSFANFIGDSETSLLSLFLDMPLGVARLRVGRLHPLFAALYSVRKVRSTENGLQYRDFGQFRTFSGRSKYRFHREVCGVVGPTLSHFPRPHHRR